MDPRSVVAGSASAAGTVRAEQAVFTSIRSPWGRGYRIVAASPGICPEEKREIVQRAPSHQSLCDASAQGRGLASFVMQSGRRCVFLAHNAGTEHSGRGDFRVHTHVLVLEPAAYRGLRCDPLAIAAAARAALAEAWLHDQPPVSLPRLQLDAHVAKDAPAAPEAADVGSLRTLLSSLLQGHRVLVHGATDPLRLLAWVWPGLPITLRERLSLSCGLRPAPGRNFPLILSAGACDERSRSGLAGDYALLAWPAAEPPDASAFDPWLNFVQQRWAAGQLAELDQLSTSLIEESTAADLARVAALCDEQARQADADVAAIEEPAPPPYCDG